VLVRGDEGRFLTARELARAQSFPDSFAWPEDCTVEEVCRGLGNAVPPNLARDVVRAVLGALG
jgi:site-specific DNA-cytosine methylase